MVAAAPIESSDRICPINELSKRSMLNGKLDVLSSKEKIMCSLASLFGLDAKDSCAQLGGHPFPKNESSESEYIVGEKMVVPEVLKGSREEATCCDIAGSRRPLGKCCRLLLNEGCFGNIPRSQFFGSSGVAGGVIRGIRPFEMAPAIAEGGRPDQLEGCGLVGTLIRRPCISLSLASSTCDLVGDNSVG